MQVGDKRGDISGKSGAGGNKRAGGFFFQNTNKRATAISIAVFETIFYHSIYSINIRRLFHLREN